MVTPGTGLFQPALAHVRNWADACGITDLITAELDIRLSHTIGLIATSDLGNVLCFKGGTALNKLYFADAARLSVDLDFNALGDELTVYRRCREVRETLVALLGEAGATMHRHKYGTDGDHFLFRYNAVSTGSTQTFKVEISLTERFAVFGTVQQSLAVPRTASPNEQIEIAVNTAGLVELIATKIRALHQRRKGRDVFDVWQAMHRITDLAVLRKLVLFYFACRSVPFDRRVFFETLDQKLRDHRFPDDVAVFLRPDVAFEWERDAAEVRQWLETVFTLDETDEDFILLTKYLAGIALGRKASAIADRVSRPLVFLMGNHLSLSEEALQFTTEDFRRLILGIQLDPNKGL